MRLLGAMKSAHLTILTYSKERRKVFVAHVQILPPRNPAEKKVREKGWISDSHHCFYPLQSRRSFCTPGLNRSTCGTGLAENHLRRVFNSQVPVFLAPLRLINWLHRKRVTHQTSSKMSFLGERKDQDLWFCLLVQLEKAQSKLVGLNVPI